MRRPYEAGVPAGPAGRGAGRATPAPGRLVASAALVAALAFVMLVLSGCAGVKTDDDDAAVAGRTPGADEVRLVVSRDFGTEILRDVVAPAGEGLDVLRLLAEHADVETGYGGRFVNGIDGLESSFGGGGSADAADWFYWVDGEMAGVGADEWKLQGGETVWWDYHPGRTRCSCRRRCTRSRGRTRAARRRSPPTPTSPGSSIGPKANGIAARRAP